MKCRKHFYVFWIFLFIVLVLFLDIYLFVAFINLSFLSILLVEYFLKMFVYKTCNWLLYVTFIFKICRFLFIDLIISINILRFPCSQITQNKWHFFLNSDFIVFFFISLCLQPSVKLWTEELIVCFSISSLIFKLKGILLNSQQQVYYRTL